MTEPQTSALPPVRAFLDVPAEAVSRPCLERW
jgi:hypothetical protein